MSEDQAAAFRQSESDVARVKQSMREAWNTPGAGYDEMAETLRPAMLHLLESVPVQPGQRLLDAATGTGLAAIEAARRGAHVTGLDFAHDLVAEARRKGTAAGVEVQWDVADIEALPYLDQTFDAVISSFGAIFAPRHDVVVHELARVLKPGGVLAFSSWKPEGPNLCMMTLTAPYVPPPPPGAFSPLDWGEREYVLAMLSPYFDDITVDEGNCPLLASSVSDATAMLFERALGPTVYVFNRLDLDAKRAMLDDATALFASCLEPDGTVNLRRDYLLVRGLRAEGGRNKRRVITFA